MARSILAAVSGYASLFVLTSLLFTALYAVLGADLAFEAGTFEASLLWIVVSTVLACAATTVGGYVCQWIAQDQAAARGLAAFILVLGLVIAGFQLFASVGDTNAVRTGGVGYFDAMNNARQPDWLVLVNPFLGAAFVLIGAHLRRGTEKSRSPDQ